MDLQLILRVVWRFKVLVACGVVLAVALGTLSFVKVSLVGGKPAMEYRQAEQWESLSTLFVTSKGFPWGENGVKKIVPQTQTPATGTDPATTDGKTTDPQPTETGPDPGQLVSLAALYVRLATSDPVLDVMKRDGKIDGVLQAFPVASGDNGEGQELPMVTLSAIAGTPEAARQLAGRHAQAFVKYLRHEQAAANIPADERVVIQVVRQPQAPTLLEARKKTRPVVVFVAVMIAVLGLAFMLENVRPRVRMLPAQEGGAPLDVVAPEGARRSA
jgi:hypothetical protein